MSYKSSKAKKGGKTEEYNRLKKEVRAKVRRDRAEWLENECAKITEANMERKSKKLFDQIKKVKKTSSKSNNSQSSINDKNGKTLTEEEDVLKRWHEYGSGLFETKDTQNTAGYINFENPEPEPLLEEVTTAIDQLKSGKSPGLDGIPAELIQNTEVACKAAIHHLCLVIWRTCTWPEDWKRQEFVMLFKKGNSKDCGNYRTIALISHTSKVLLIIILNRMRKKVEEELSDVQAGYRSNRGTIDMLFTLQNLIEKIRNTEEEAFIIFIDYSKALDSVKHHRLFEIMIEMGFPKHLVALIAGLYDHQKATIRWNGEHTEFFGINKGVRQGCILSPHLFSVYTEQVMRNADIDFLGIKIGGRMLADLRYADDTALGADNITSSKRMLHRVDRSGEKEGLGLNAPKTNYMHIKGKNSLKDEDIQIKVKDTALKKVQDFKYLGSIKSADGTCTKDIKARIAMGKSKMTELNNIWKDRSIPFQLKIKLLKCLIWPVVIYGCEAWTLRKADESRLEAVEMWFFRRLSNISWEDRRTNQSVLEELGLKRSFLNEIKKRRLKYVGHAVRNPRTDLMTTVLQGKVEGKRNRGRPSMIYIDNIMKDSGLSLSQIVRRSENRDDWRRVVANAGAANFEHGDANR